MGLPLQTPSFAVSVTPGDSELVGVIEGAVVTPKASPHSGSAAGTAGDRAAAPAPSGLMVARFPSVV